MGDLRKLLERQARELLDLERQHVKEAFGLYREFRADLIDRLDFLNEQGLRVTATRYGRAIGEAGEAVASLRKKFAGQLGQSVQPIAELAQQHLIEQLAAFEERFPGTVSPFTPAIGKTVKAASGLLRPQFDSSVAGYAAKVETDIRQRLAVSLMAGEDGRDARRRVVPGYLQPVPREGPPPVVAYWAQKIVGDQTARTSGTVKLQMLADGQEKSEKLQKRWCYAGVEGFGKKRVVPCERCSAMDGQVVDVDEVFKSPDGDELMSPPLHPNCRCSVIPWTEDLAPAAEDLSGKKAAEPEPEPAPKMVALTPEMSPAASASVVRANAVSQDASTTAAMQSLESPDAKLIGLNHRIKSESSLTRKIGDEAVEKGITPAQMAAKVKDSLRYTLQIDPEKYAEAVPRHLAALEQQGFTVTDLKNYWKPGAIYQGVNTNLRTPLGTIIELQFHTADSFHTKEVLNHPLYEEHRLPATSNERKAELEAEMRANQAKVPIPPGVYNLKLFTPPTRKSA